MLEVHSWTDESSGETKIFFAEKGAQGQFVVFNLYTHQTMSLELGQKVPEEFVLTIPWNLSQEIPNALAQWLARKGVRNDHDAKLEGTLKATRYHLEDLRELLKLTSLSLYKVDEEGNFARGDYLTP